VNAHDAYSAILARLAGAPSRTPVVTTLQLVASAYRPHVAAADRMTSALRDAGTIAISREVRREWLDSPLRPAMRRTRSAVIGNPVDGAAADAAVAVGRDAVRRRLGLPPDAVLATNVGRYVEQKAQDRLLDAMALLVPRHPSLHMMIVGYGVLEDALRRQAIRLGLTDRVHLLVHRLDALEIVAASDVFVFPSRYEGLGVAPLEAMWMGVPVVANDIPPLTEFVRDGETGVLAKAAEPARLAAAVERVLADPSGAQRMAARAREEVRAAFSAEAIARRYSRFLLEAM
jgi:glycosyltransferase involved in cell wall biosynthesis